MIFRKNDVYNVLYRKYPDDISLDVIAVLTRTSGSYYFFRVVHKRVSPFSGPSLKIHISDTREYLIEQIGTLEDFPEYNL